MFPTPSTFQVPTRRRVSQSQSSMTSSVDAEAMYLPSVEKTTDLTPPLTGMAERADPFP